MSEKIEVFTGSCVENASSADIEAILSVQAQKVTEPETANTALAESGFLVYPVSADELSEVLADGENHLLKVAREGCAITGYLLSYDMKKWETIHPGWISNLEIADSDREMLKKEKTLYGRHIAVAEQPVSAGTGKQLLDSTLQEAADRGYRLFVVEILEAPIRNIRSANFVQKAGFRRLGQSTDQNDRIWSVFLKDLFAQNFG